MSVPNLLPTGLSKLVSIYQSNGLLLKVMILFLLVGGLLLTNWTLSKSFIYSGLREITKANTLNKVKSLTWLEGEHFIVRYYKEDERVAKLILNNAESIYQPVTSAFNYFPKDKVNIIIYPTREELGKSFGWEADESAMGVYWAGVIRVLSPYQWIHTSDSTEMMQIFTRDGPMAHEFSHLVIDYRTKGNYPRWFTEGLAQYMELKLTGFKFDEPQGKLNQRLYSFRDMDHNYDYLPNQSLAYRQSLAAIQFLVKNNGEKVIQKLLELLSAGYSLEDAIKQVTGSNFVDFEADFRQWASANADHL